MGLKLSDLKSNFTLTLGYLNPALSKPTLGKTLDTHIASPYSGV